MNNNCAIFDGTYLTSIRKGGQNEYIDTGYKPTEKSMFEIKYTPKGDRIFEWGNSLLSCYRNYDDKFLCSYKGENFLVKGCTYNKEHIINIKKQSINIDGTEYILNSLEFDFDSSSNDNVWLFQSPYQNRAKCANMELYYFKIFEDDILKMHLIPCKDKNNILCLWDDIGKQYYYFKEVK